MIRHPPRLALELLSRLLPDDDPLVGDLVEEFQSGRSAAWFWWQSVGAVAAARRRPDTVRPLKLVARPSRLDLDPSEGWPLASGGPLAYLSASPVRGIGGLGLMLVILLATLVAPGLWWIVVSAMAAGGVLGVVLVKRSARQMHADPRAFLRKTLFQGDEPTVARRAGYHQP